MIGSDVSYCFSFWNTSSASSVQTKGLDFRRSLKNWRACSISLEINGLSQASRELLDILNAGWRPHLFDCFDLLWIGLDSLV
jgi:hypothetical protein